MLRASIVPASDKSCLSGVVVASVTPSITTLHPQPLQRAMVECREQAQRMAPVASATTMGESNWGLWPLCRQTTRRSPDARAFAAMPLTPQRTLQNSLCAGTDFVATQPGMWLLFVPHTRPQAHHQHQFLLQLHRHSKHKRQLCAHAPEHETSRGGAKWQKQQRRVFV